MTPRPDSAHAARRGRQETAAAPSPTRARRAGQGRLGPTEPARRLTSGMHGRRVRVDRLAAPRLAHPASDVVAPPPPPRRDCGSGDPRKHSVSRSRHLQPPPGRSSQLVARRWFAVSQWETVLIAPRTRRFVRPPAGLPPVGTERATAIAPASGTNARPPRAGRGFPRHIHLLLRQHRGQTAATAQRARQPRCFAHAPPLQRPRQPAARRPGLFGLWALGFGLWALGFGLWALGSGIWDLGFGIWDLGFQF
jgi:hypothetical protein